MKKYALCSENKMCVGCGATLQLTRKSATWINESTKATIDRPTNIYSCKSCQIDHIMKGFQTDDSGWARLNLPVESLPGRHSSSSDQKGSKVTSYIDPKIVADHQKQIAAAAQKKPHYTIDKPRDVIGYR